MPKYTVTVNVTESWDKEYEIEAMTENQAVALAVHEAKYDEFIDGNRSYSSIVVGKE